MPRDPVPPSHNVIPLCEPANDNGLVPKVQVKVLIPKDLPVTQTEIEVFALLLDDLMSFAANDNEVQPE